ncbi:hypothetical protein QJS04_geneDACA003587 [Acorus gramineus]|uniref:Exonuclease domain-containing protein n=1 Tax=Acorus gramineus TaxID=55184 RepID=A0AAV9BP53_ACOGR|nr:hypothetical protein QJS04_geneDACA003587 [Acorus gramineus]
MPHIAQRPYEALKPGTMQVIYEASPGCPKTKKFSNGLHVSGIGIEAFPKPKNEKTNISGGTEESDNASKRGISLPPGELYCKPIYQQDCCFLYGFHPELQSLYQNPWNPYEGHFYAMSWEYPPPINSRVHYMPYNIFSQGYPNEFQFQEFQYFVVIDFEATCDKGKLIHPQEIIEFPSVLVNSVTGQLEASFQTYVRPSYHQHLTDFCRELTGIRQVESVPRASRVQVGVTSLKVGYCQVDRGVPLSEALLMHDKWLEERGVKHTKFAVVTWSDWDCNVMLESECKYKRIRKPPYFNRWINLRVPFQEVYGNIRCNLKEAVEMAGLTWEGRPHCGLDDARNTARLLTLLMLNGFRFSITKSLPWPIEDPRNILASMGRCGKWTVKRGAVCNYFEWAS